MAKKTKDNVPITGYVPRELRQVIEQDAEDLGQAISVFVRRALEIAHKALKEERRPG